MGEQPARRRRVEGIYVLISKTPPHLQIEVGKQTEKKAFTIEDRSKLREILISAFGKKEYDRGLLEASAIRRQGLRRQPGFRVEEVNRNARATLPI